MQACRLFHPRECPDALEGLYEAYRASLPASKQVFLSPKLPVALLADDGLVCFQGQHAVAALLWRRDRGMPFRLISADFYAESLEATFASVEMLVDAFLRDTAECTIQFELWTGTGARIHELLRRHGFPRLERRLLSLDTAPSAATEPGEIKLVSLREFPLTEARLANLAEALCRSYAGMVDGQFYAQYHTPESCRAYLSGVLASPGCNTRHSWLALATDTDSIVGAALCQSWPRGRALYLEQLFVDPRHRGRGAGRNLFLQTARALKQGVARQMVWTVSQANLPAMKLYHSLGAIELSAECACACAAASPVAPVVPA